LDDLATFDDDSGRTACVDDLFFVDEVVTDVDNDADAIINVSQMRRNIVTTIVASCQNETTLHEQSPFMHSLKVQTRLNMPTSDDKYTGKNN